MINEKLILETLANHTERLAQLQTAIAALTAVIEAKMPNLSPEQKATLKNGIAGQLKDAELLKSGAERLQQEIRRLE